MRILCVDDDRLVLSVTADLLRDLGHDVIEASSVEAAEQDLSHTTIDLLITDVNMPGGRDGQQLGQSARLNRPDLRVIYFSGLGHRNRLATGEAILMKPCNRGDLQKAIAGAVH